MAELCYFYRLSPQQYWELETPEYDAMKRLMEKVQEARSKVGARRGRR